MSSILMDSWALETGVHEALLGRASRFDTNKICWQNFLSAIILWDSIYNVCSSPDIIYWFTDVLDKSYIKKLRKAISSVDLDMVNQMNENVIFKRSHYDVYSFSACAKTTSTELNGKSFYCSISPDMSCGQCNKRTQDKCFRCYHGMAKYENLLETKDVWQRAKDYLLLSSVVGLNYFPHPERAKIINNQNPMQFKVLRQDYIDLLDKEIVKYYDEMNERFKKQAFVCTYPLLYDFIRDNSSSPVDELKAALDIRQDKDVVAFRNSMDELEDKINNGDVKAADIAIKQIEEMSNKIIHGNGEKQTIGKMSLKLFPIITPSIDLAKDICIGKKTKVINIAFLSKLSDFAIHNRLKK